jgi:hypothetical protein
VVFTAPVRRGDLISGALHLEWRVKTGIRALKLHSTSGLVVPSPVVNSAPNYCKLQEGIAYAISPRKREFLTLLAERGSFVDWRQALMMEELSAVERIVRREYSLRSSAASIADVR